MEISNGDVCIDGTANWKVSLYTDEAAYIAQRKIEICHLPQTMFDVLYQTELENIEMRASINAMFAE